MLDFANKCIDVICVNCFIDNLLDGVTLENIFDKGDIRDSLAARLYSTDSKYASYTTYHSNYLAVSKWLSINKKIGNRLVLDVVRENKDKIMKNLNLDSSWNPMYSKGEQIIADYLKLQIPVKKVMATPQVHWLLPKLKGKISDEDINKLIVYFNREEVTPDLVDMIPEQTYKEAGILKMGTILMIKKCLHSS